jgi:hypothetical protein
VRYAVTALDTTDGTLPATCRPRSGSCSSWPDERDVLRDRLEWQYRPDAVRGDRQMKPRFGLALALVLPALASGCGGGEEEGPGYVATIKPAFVAAEESFADTIVPCLQREYDECAETGRAGRAAAQALIGKLEETSSPPEVRDAHQHC